MAPKIPLPPPGGTIAAPNGLGPQAIPPAPSHVSPRLAAMTKHDARLVNLDTGTHVDSEGKPHKTHPGNRPRVGPLTIIFASKMGHPPMRFGDHAKMETPLHKRMRRRGQPHPDALAIEIAHRMQLPKAPPKKGKSPPEGSPAEEAAETPRQEAAERARLPLPPRKAA